MSKHLLPFLLSFVFCLLSSAFGGLIHVPQDQLSIQAGINAAVNGDTVLVADSTYYENINFMGKAITVASYFIMDSDSVHIDSTIINGSQPANPNAASVVTFESGEDTTSVLCGFTITGGTGTVSADSRVGGGVCCYSSGARIAHNKIIGNSIVHNSARGAGIGTFPFGNNNFSIVEDNFISSNTCTGVQRGQGGGIYMPQGKINHNIIRENLCQSGQNGYALGGGIHGASDTSVVRYLHVTNNLIEYNQSMNSEFSSRGGGVDTWGGVVVYLMNNTITHNQVIGLYTYGSGVDLIYSKAPSIIQDNIISFNSSTGSTDSHGGGLYYYQITGLTIRDNYFEGNWSFLGGGISSSFGIGNYIYGNDFINNEARSGGGIYIYDSEDTLYANKIYGNRASLYNGGGIYIYDCSPMVLNNIITGNKSGLNGGGIYISGTSNAAQIINNTIVADTAGLNGGGICIGSDSVIVMNTILWENSATNGEQIFSSGVNTQVVFCDVQGSSVWPGTGNKNVNPELVADSLANSSPCIGAGIDFYDFGGGMICYCPPEDINGRMRPYPSGSDPDMGAWESKEGIVGIDVQPFTGILNSYELFQNYPNPFNPTTVISWQLAVSNPVKLTVYTLNGQKVATLLDEKQPAGTHSVEWDASGLASGVYFYRLEAKKFKQVRKMLLVR